MNHSIVALCSTLRRYANEFLEDRLSANGLQGIVPSHGDILQNLFRYQELSMQDLAEKIRRTKATTTVLVDKLEKLGLVQRVKDSSDCRVRLLTLTEKGKSYEAVFKDIGNELNELIMKNISEEEALMLESVLDRVISGFSEDHQKK